MQRYNRLRDHGGRPRNEAAARCIQQDCNQQPSENQIVLRDRSGRADGHKNRRFEGTTVSYFSVLAEPVRVVAAYARNKEVIQDFESSDYELFFFIYGKRLKQKLADGIKRQQLFAEAVTFLNNTSRFARLGLEIIEEILNYLTLEEVDLLDYLFCRYQVM